MNSDCYKGITSVKNEVIVNGIKRLVTSLIDKDGKIILQAYADNFLFKKENTYKFEYEDTFSCCETN